MTPRELGEWLEFLSGDDGGDGQVAMLIAHFDESASQNPKDVFVVAGYLAPAKQWPKFQRRWTATLERYGIDPPVFHMTDFENSRERFAADRLPVERRVPLLRELMALIRKYALVGVASAFPAEEYALICEEFVPRGRYEPPYAIHAAQIHEPTSYCLLACMQHLERFRVEHRLRGKIACVFDRNPSVAGKIVEFYDRMIDTLALQSFRPGITFSPRDEAVPLQAADILAYEAMKHVRNQVMQPGTRPTRKALEELSRDMKLYGAFYEPAKLRWFFTEAARRTREHVRTEAASRE